MLALNPFLKTVAEELAVAPPVLDELAALDVRTPLQLLTLLRLYPDTVPESAYLAHRVQQAVEGGILRVESRAANVLKSLPPKPVAQQFQHGTAPVAGFGQDPATEAQRVFHGKGGVRPSMRPETGPRVGASAGLGSARAAPPPRSISGAYILLEPPSGWFPTVHNQGERLTCTAFALLAALEPRLWIRNSRWFHLPFNGIERWGRKLFGTPPHKDLSPQYLFWAAKQHDGAPQDDATTLDATYRALCREGVCESRRWPYMAHSIPGDPTHGGPQPRARDCAAWRRGVHPMDVFVSRWHGSMPAHPAGWILAHLQSRRAVAVSLPMFLTSGSSTEDNWRNPHTYANGAVQEVRPGTPEAGLGHAVCIVGFSPDEFAPGGGYFLFRNSWGTGYGRLAPAAPFHTPFPGYGQVSAAYIDAHLWEACVV